MSNQNNPIPISEEVLKWWINERKEAYDSLYNYGIERAAEAMYRHLAPEIEALKKERDEYRKLLKKAQSSLHDEEWGLYAEINHTLAKYTKP